MKIPGTWVDENRAGVVNQFSGTVSCDSLENVWIDIMDGTNC